MIFNLTDEQRYFYDNQKTAPNSTMYNHFPMLEKLKESVDIEKLIQSLLKTLEAHPAYLTVIEERNGVPVQRYIPDIINNIPVEKISESELMTLKDDLIQPFYFGQVMCRFKIFITEKAKYLFFDDHHIVCDGIGKVIFGATFKKFMTVRKFLATHGSIILGNMRLLNLQSIITNQKSGMKTDTEI